MVTRAVQLLQKHTDNLALRSVIAEAIGFLSSSRIEREEGPTGSGESSASIADLHAFRKQSGYYKAGAVSGLEETIESLRSRNVDVRSRIVETSDGYVALWFDEQEMPLGVLIFRKTP